MANDSIYGELSDLLDNNPIIDDDMAKSRLRKLNETLRSYLSQSQRLQKYLATGKGILEACEGQEYANLNRLEDELRSFISQTDLIDICRKHSGKYLSQTPTAQIVPVIQGRLDSTKLNYETTQAQIEATQTSIIEAGQREDPAPAIADYKARIKGLNASQDVFTLYLYEGHGYIILKNTTDATQARDQFKGILTELGLEGEAIESGVNDTPAIGFNKGNPLMNSWIEFRSVKRGDRDYDFLSGCKTSGVWVRPCFYRQEAEEHLVYKALEKMVSDAKKA